MFYAWIKIIMEYNVHGLKHQTFRPIMVPF